jgi:hypothetical protein
LIIATGEVIPFDYEPPSAKLDQSKKPNFRSSARYIPVEKSGSDASENKVFRKKVTNSLYPLLINYSTMSEAKNAIWYLDDLLVGIPGASVNEGSTRPLSQRKLFNLLRTLPVITTNTVLDATRYSVRHSERLALCLRTIIRASERLSKASAPYSKSTGTGHSTSYGKGHVWHGETTPTFAYMSQEALAIAEADIAENWGSEPSEALDNVLTPPI